MTLDNEEIFYGIVVQPARTFNDQFSAQWDNITVIGIRN